MDVTGWHEEEYNPSLHLHVWFEQTHGLFHSIWCPKIKGFITIIGHDFYFRKGSDGGFVKLRKHINSTQLSTQQLSAMSWVKIVGFCWEYQIVIEIVYRPSFISHPESIRVVPVVGGWWHNLAGHEARHLCYHDAPWIYPCCSRCRWMTTQTGRSWSQTFSPPSWTSLPLGCLLYQRTSWQLWKVWAVLWVFLGPLLQTSWDGLILIQAWLTCHIPSKLYWKLYFLSDCAK